MEMERRAVQSASLLSSSASALDSVSGAVLASSFIVEYTQSIIYHTRVSPSSTTHRAAERHQTTAAENKCIEIVLTNTESDRFMK